MDRIAESGPYELLLGRGTYEIFAAHWPYHRARSRNDSTAPQARRLDDAREGRVEQLHTDRGDVAEYVAELKSEDGPEIQVHGRPGLIQTLLEHDLIDEYRLSIFPVMLGAGKRFFGDGTIPSR